MRSHHAPTRKLLERFTYKDRQTRTGKSIWVYEKGRAIRSTSDLGSECAEHRYFSGSASGVTEQVIDSRLNEQYEGPFNSLLPAMDADFYLFESLEVKQICANYLAQLFYRSKARREGLEVTLNRIATSYRQVALSPLLLRSYAAKISLTLRRAVWVTRLRQVMLRMNEEMVDPGYVQTYYVDDLRRSVAVQAAYLSNLEWTVAHSNSSERVVISDTPVVSLTRDALGQLQYGNGIAKPSTEWNLPLSHARVLIVGHRKRSSVLNQSDVTALNFAQVLTMSSRLYSRSHDNRLNTLVQSYGGRYKIHVDVFRAEDRSIEHMLSLDPSFA